MGRFPWGAAHAARGIDMDLEQARRKLEKYGQLHVLKFYDTLSHEEQQALLEQIEKTDFNVLRYAKNPHKGLKRGKITPLGAMEIGEIEKNREKYTEIGLQAIREGKIGAVLLAGGMGTRLGFDEPKCMYDIGITHPVYIMQRLIENLLDVVREAGVTVPLFIMTSDKNNDATVRFMEEHAFFGYDREKVVFFKQEMAPAVDFHDRVYMESKCKIATSPNGNGGWFLSMMRTGALDKAKDLGIEWLNIFAVDNVLQRIADPCFIGATLDCNCSTGAKAVRKVAPDEKVGALCLEDGKPSIVEYYDMTPELMAAKDANGNPAYNFGVIMNYLFREKDLERIVDEVLPVHVVEKKIPYIDEEGNLVEPDEPNGYKFEQLAVDMVRELDTCLPYEVVREREFAPIKNPTGVDSVESARELCKLNGIEL